MKCTVKMSNWGKPTHPERTNWVDSSCILPEGHTTPHLFIEKDGSLSWWEYNPMEDSDGFNLWNPETAIERAQMADVRLYCSYATSCDTDKLWAAGTILARMERRQIVAEKYRVRLPWISVEGRLEFVPTNWAQVAADEYY